MICPSLVKQKTHPDEGLFQRCPRGEVQYTSTGKGKDMLVAMDFVDYYLESTGIPCIVLCISEVMNILHVLL